MPQSNASCSSCVCCGTADDPTPCCNSSKCEINIQQQKSLSCCNDEDYDINCPMCREFKSKASQSSCKCAKSVSNQCSICKERMEKLDNKCSSCKMKEGMKKILKEIRCPSCSQSVQLQCSMPEGIPSINIMLIPDKLLKDSSTNTRCCEERDEGEMCCKPSKSSLKKNTCCMTEKPSKTSCAEDCANMKKLEISSADQAPIPKPPDKPDQSPIKSSEEKTNKNKPTAQCSEECAAQGGDDNCSCIFPPAFKQYMCTGKIAGVCDCTKKG